MKRICRRHKEFGGGKVQGFSKSPHKKMTVNFMKKIYAKEKKMEKSKEIKKRNI